MYCCVLKIVVCINSSNFLLTKESSIKQTHLYSCSRYGGHIGDIILYKSKNFFHNIYHKKTNLKKEKQILSHS